MVDSRWFVSANADGLERAVRIYCFPHAGGNPRSFLSWQRDMGEDADITVVCPPGRLHRFREPALTEVVELANGAVEAIAATADRPFLLFGHSFGAVVAFEAARRLRDMPALRGLIASGCSAPALLPTRRVVETARLEGREFTEAVGFFGGVPPEVLADEALQELLLPNLRSDLRMVARYQYRPAAPLPVPITLINGADDPHVKEVSVEPWARECVEEPVQHWPAGGHFYFDGHPEAVTDVLRPLVRAARGVISNMGDHPVGDHVELI